MDSRFLECSSPAGFERFECLRFAPVVAVERPPDVRLRRLVLFFYKDIQCGCPFFVKKSFTSGVYYKKLLEKICTLSKKSLEKVYILSKSRLKKFVISYITPLKK